MSRFVKKLNALRLQNRLRRLQKPHGIDLSSNDYLGFADHPFLKQAAIEAIESGIPMGAGGSRLLRGHTSWHEELEACAAEDFGYERTLYFSSGYQANMAIFQALPSRQDVIIFDEHVHASARQGIRANPAHSIKVRHNDLDAFEGALKQSQEKRRSDGMIWVAVEGLYSMDGDVAPVEELYALCQKYEAMLIVDEAHSLGVSGENGRGLCHGLDRSNLIVLYTCGKSLGVAGGLVCGPVDVIDMIINDGRSFIYSTAPPPLQAYLVQKSLELLVSEEGQKQRRKLNNVLHKIKSFLETLSPQLYTDEVSNNINLLGWGQGARVLTPIIPLVVGDDARAMEFAAAMQAAGYDIRAIRPPTVPEGTARLRLSLNANLSESDLHGFFDVLENIIHK